MPRSGADFFPRIPPTAHLLVLDLGFLGDTIHLIPALAAIRRALPQAKLEVMVAEHIQGILAVCPWLDGVSGYPRYPKGPRWYQDFGRVGALRAKFYDAVINLNGSDRSSILTRLAGAPLRLGRQPPKISWFWPRCYTHVVNVPFNTQILFRQRLAALAAAGFPVSSTGPFFPIEIPAVFKERVSVLLGSDRPFLHVSPFATADEKELPPQVLANLLNTIAASRPDLSFILSTASNDRERAKLADLCALLSFQAWKIFPGDLNLVELAEVMRRARIHLGGDSGALHVALMAGTPTFSWWRDYAGRVEWQPAGPRHAAILGRTGGRFIGGIDHGAACATLRKLLDETAP